MVMSAWGEEERYSDWSAAGWGGNGSESCFVAARNRNGDKKGTNRHFEQA